MKILLIQDGTESYVGVREDAILYELGGCWGDKIELVRIAENGIRKVCGWKNPRPLPGDVLQFDSNGRKFISIFIRVEHLNNPPDMFFGECQDICYLDSIPSDHPIAKLIK